jgi:hypothetical protein
MSYESVTKLPHTSRVQDVQEFLKLLGFRRLLRPSFRIEGEIAQYYWFEETDYRSYAGVALSIYMDKDGQLAVYTRTVESRSYYDLEQQNRTIRSLKRRFGGTFETDFGKGRYFPPYGNPPTPPQAGCHLAFQRFGEGLIRADIYLMNREFPQEHWKHTGQIEFLDQMNPRLLSNNLLLPYLVAVLEDYFKSTFVALLQYSDRKESFLRGGRLSSEHLLRISSGESSVEAAVAEVLPFQRISAICQHFKSLDPNLDLAGTLRKPYRRRKKSLFETLEELVLRRHAFIHQGRLDTSFDDADVKRTLDDLEESLVRCYRRITDYYGWEFDQGWGRGKRPKPRKEGYNSRGV